MVAVAQHVSEVDKPEGTFLDSSADDRVFFLISGQASLVIADPEVRVTREDVGRRPATALASKGPLSDVFVSHDSCTIPALPFAKHFNGFVSSKFTYLLEAMRRVCWIFERWLESASLF